MKAHCKRIFERIGYLAGNLGIGGRELLHLLVDFVFLAALGIFIVRQVPGGVVTLLIPVLLSAKIRSLHLGERLREFQIVNRKLTHFATIDYLTGLLARAAFEEKYNALADLCQRQERSFAVLFIDVDGFKPKNDRYGHTHGDAILRQVGQVVKDSNRKAADIAGRWGGDELLLVLDDTNREEANAIAERILQGVRTAFPECPVTVSIGVAVCPVDTSDRCELIKIADARMYQAKAQGGDRVIRA